MSRGFLRPVSEGVVLKVTVSPGARRTSVEGPYGEDALKLRVAAPPVDGKANAELRRFLAEALGLSGSGVSVLRGASSRDKTVLIRSADPEAVRETLLSSGPR